MSSVPGNLRYTEEHEWVLVEDNVATVGITDHAQTELGDITFVELPDEDAELTAGDEACTIESVKAASPVFAPLSGQITEINNDLEENPESVNQDPYGAGWIFKIELADPAAADKLMSPEDYEAFLEKESDDS